MPNVADRYGGWYDRNYRVIYADNGYRIVAWDNSPAIDEPYTNKAKLTYLRSNDILWECRWFALPVEHLAFILGTMPSYVYADWLEENLEDVPKEVFAILRDSVLTTAVPSV